MRPICVLLILAGCGRCSSHDAEPAAKRVDPTPSVSTPSKPACRAKRTERAAERRDGAAVDAHGTPLPPHAIARLGDARMRSGGRIDLVLMCAGAVITVDENGVVFAWDAATGARKERWLAKPEFDDPIERMQCVDGQPRFITHAGDDVELDIATGTAHVRSLGDDVLDAVQRPDDTVVVRTSAIDRVPCTGAKTLLRALGPDDGAPTLSHDGTKLAIRSADAVMLSTDLAKPFRKLAVPAATGVEWSTDDSRLLVHHEDGKLSVVDARGMVERVLGPFEESVTSSAMSADLVALGLHDGTLLRFELATGAALPPLRVVRSQMYGAVRSLAFSAAGDQLAIGGEDQIVRVIDARATGAPVDRKFGHQEWIWTSTFSGDGTQIATASSDDTVRVWDAKTGAELATLAARDDENARPMLGVAWPPGSLVAADDYEEIRRWSDGSFERLADPTPPTKVERLVASLDRKVIGGATTGGWWLVDAQTFAVLGSGTLAKPGKLDLMIDTIAIDGRGERLAYCVSAQPSRIVVVARSGAVVWSRALGDQDNCPDLALSPDGAWLASGAELVSLATKKIVKLGTAELGAVAFSPDGKLLASAIDTGELQIWSIKTRTVIHRLTGHDAGVFSISWSPSGDRIVSGGRDLDALVWKID